MASHIYCVFTFFSAHLLAFVYISHATCPLCIFIFSCTCVLCMQHILAHVHTPLHIFTFQHVALYFYIICCFFHSHHFTFKFDMYLTHAYPACFPLCPFLGVAIVRVALACFPNFHVLYLPQARPRADCCTPGICFIYSHFQFLFRTKFTCERG